jgi:putative transposase
MACGNRRGANVLDDGDRELFLETFVEACGRTGWEVFAWVLMDNHYHAVFRTPEPNLVGGMQWFQKTYTRRLNAKRRFRGHLFGGRYSRA